MLYIWPCIAFFSWPALLPSLANISQKRVPRAHVIVVFMGLMLLAVHFNTIVHPFTLADNRHYVFYVFRILLRHPLIKYAAVPVYFACAWLVINAMEEAPGSDDSQVRHEVKPKGHQDDISPSLDLRGGPTRVSFILVWLAATSMSLVTAPLVEPRYFIVPWLMWRINLPNELRREDNHDRRDGQRQGLASRGLSWVILNRLWIETFWYLFVNLVTCYIFLYKGFAWPQEPGKVQRFMW
jgi:alpha-1,2-glucosyltransferase